jgi:hypothetical protein
MSNLYPVPERGHVYRHCVMCRRPFRVCNSQLARRGAKFCTVKCYHAALRAFREALASDRLELILANELERMKTESKEASWRSFSNNRGDSRSVSTTQELERS